MVVLSALKLEVPPHPTCAPPTRAPPTTNSARRGESRAAIPGAKPARGDGAQGISGVWEVASDLRRRVANVGDARRRREREKRAARWATTVAARAEHVRGIPSDGIPLCSTAYEYSGSKSVREGGGVGRGVRGAQQPPQTAVRRRAGGSTPRDTRTTFTRISLRQSTYTESRAPSDVVVVLADESVLVAILGLLPLGLLPFAPRDGLRAQRAHVQLVPIGKVPAELSNPRRDHE